MSLFRLVYSLRCGGCPRAHRSRPRAFPRRARSQQPSARAPRFMVANPFAFAPADSAPPSDRYRHSGTDEEHVDATISVVSKPDERGAEAVRLPGRRHPESVVGHHPRQEHPGPRARDLHAGQGGEGARYTVTARLAGVNDEAGNVVTLTQSARRDARDFGKSSPRRCSRPCKSMPTPRPASISGPPSRTRPPSAANKALKALPNNGLAEYCLAPDRHGQEGATREVVKHLQAVGQGRSAEPPGVDRSRRAQYQAANDTANMLVTFKQMLRVAPTNQKLREEPFKYFLQSGHPETAKRSPTRASRSTPTTPTCTTSRATRACS